MYDLECPYCNYVNKVDCEDILQEDELGEQECGECLKHFAYKTNITIDFEGFKADCLNDSPHNYEPLKTYPAYFTKMCCRSCGDCRDPTTEEREQHNLPLTYDWEADNA